MAAVLLVVECASSGISAWIRVLHRDGHMEYGISQIYVFTHVLCA
jgi:hypothetical protein